MLERTLEAEVMDSAEEAVDYDAMDHRLVNQLFVNDFFLAHAPANGSVLDLGTGTAQIPIELCRRQTTLRVVAVDMARHMLERGEANVATAGLAGRIRLELCDAKHLPYGDIAFDAVMSNSIVHHIPDPSVVLAEMVRVCRPGGLLFVRDLLRPDDEEAVERLVALHAIDANPHQRQMFADSLRAALTVQEMREKIVPLGFAAETVQPTSDRHWTWVAQRP